MKIPSDTSFIVDLVIEVEGEDSIEVMDYRNVTPPDHGVDDETIETLCDTADLGQIFPLDEEGIIIAPDPGVYIYKVAVNVSQEEYTTLSSNRLTDEEASEMYAEPVIPECNIPPAEF